MAPAHPPIAYRLACLHADLAERSATYASSLRLATGPPVGSTFSLGTHASGAPPPSDAAVATLMSQMLSEPVSSRADRDDANLARTTAAAVADALQQITVQGKHEVLVSIG